jgi:hypothetical protein
MAIQIVREVDGEVVWTLSTGDEGTVIVPAERVSYTLVWDQKSNSGEQVSLGWYSVIVNDITITKSTEPRETVQTFDVLGRFQIQAPD